MSSPPSPYSRQYDFTGYQASNPTAPLPGNKVDQELNAVLTTLNATISRLGEVQRDDGKVRDSALNLDTIGAAVSTYVSGSVQLAINNAKDAQIAAVNTEGATQVAAVNAAGASFASTATSVSVNAASAAASATTAEGWKVNAQASALSATNSANNAFNHAGTAFLHASNAAAYRDEAGQHAAAAFQSFIDASGAAGTAANYSGDAYGYKEQANTYRAGALAAQSAAEAAASQATNTVANATALVVSNIQPYLDAAAGSASSAAVSASNASSSASSAATSANNASYEASVAGSHATYAAASATEAAETVAAFGLTIGTVNTISPGGSASVTVSGTAPAYTLDFDIPAGAAGNDGVDGTDGVDGATGPAGPAGTSLNVEGAWGSYYVSYQAGDIVYYNGTAYLCVNSVTSGTTPDVDTTNWAAITFIGPAGPTGATGPQGASLNPRGVWSYGNSYSAGDYVTYSGQVYVANNYIGYSYNDPSSDTSNWSPLAIVGPTGPTGLTGPTGPQGPAGNLNSTSGLDGSSTYTLTTNIPDLSSNTLSEASASFGSTQYSYPVKISSEGIQFNNGTTQVTAGISQAFADSTYQSVAGMSAFQPVSGMSAYQQVSSMVSYLAKSGNLSGLTDLTAARSNLGLGTMATATAANYALLSGSTFTGKVTLPQSLAASAPLRMPYGQAPTTPVSGDVWTTSTGLWFYNGTTSINFAALNASNQFTAGKTQYFTHDSTAAGIGISPAAGDPSSVNTGDLWYNITTGKLRWGKGSANLQNIATESWVAAGQTFTGLVTTAASTNTTAGFNLPHGAAPTAPVNGDVWTDTTGFYYRINGATVTPATLAGGTYTGLISTVASTTTNAGFRLPHGASPTSPVNGDLWTTSTGLFVRVNSVTLGYPAVQNSNSYASGTKQTFGAGSTTNAPVNIPASSSQPTSPSSGDIWHFSTAGQIIGYSNSMRSHMTACRAFVNFDGSGTGTWAGGTSTVTRAASSTTATITTTTAHGLAVGNNINVLTGVAAGIYAVATVPSTTTFTITTVATTALTAASITFAVNTIRSSFNVSSITDNGVGDYTINFTWPMVDDTYSCFFSVNSAGGTNATTYAAAVKAAGIVNTPDLKTTSAVRIIVASTSATADLNLVQASFFR